MRLKDDRSWCHFFPLTFYLFIFVVLGFELRAYTLNHSTNPFCDGVFQDRISPASCWLQIMILLISASWVARITGVSHRRLAAPHILSMMTLMAGQWGKMAGDWGQLDCSLLLYCTVPLGNLPGVEPISLLFAAACTCLRDFWQQSLVLSGWLLSVCSSFWH
jgi:hypothetical protein